MSGVCNAYNSLPIGVDVYDNDNNLVGVSLDIRARCTAKSPGGVTIRRPSGVEFWYSGDVEKYLIDTWTLLNYGIPNGSFPNK